MITREHDHRRTWSMITGGHDHRRTWSPEVSGARDRHNTLLSVQVSLIALFRLLDLDMLAARTAPQNSYRNRLERIMSLISLELWDRKCHRKWLFMQITWTKSIKLLRRPENWRSTLSCLAPVQLLLASTLLTDAERRAFCNPRSCNFRKHGCTVC